MDKLLSVITITYNNYGELIKTLESTAKLDFVENIIVNGGNCEKTKKYLDDSKYIHVSEQDNGIYDAFNKGLSLSNNKYVIYLNSGDTLLDPNYWIEAIAFLETNEKTSFTHSDIIFDDEIAGKLNFTPHNQDIGRGMPYFHQTLITRASVFKRIGSFNTDFNIAGDYDFVVRMLKENLTGKHFPVASVLMDGKGVSSTKEFKSINECLRSLKVNKMLSFKTRIYLFKRLIFTLARKFIHNLFGRKAINLFKRYKYNK